MENLLKDLCSFPATPGNEREICSFIKEKLSKFASVRIENDNSVIATLGNKNSTKHILFDAHIDNIGLVVTDILDSGFVKFDTCGGFDPRVLYGNLVTIHGKVDLNGVVCSTPVHLGNKKEKKFSIDDLFIDAGIPKKDLESLVNPGDPISFGNKFFKLLNNNISSPATDNRAGVYILMKLAEKLSKEVLDSKVSLLFSSREEIGAMGAKISSYKLYPCEAICVDVSFAKQPHVSEGKYGEIGKGGLIGISPSLSAQISIYLQKLAKEKNIPYQLEVIPGKSGTTADVISTIKGGIPCGLVSVPQRYMHTGVEIVNLDDVESIVDLLFEYTKNGGVNSESGHEIT